MVSVPDEFFEACLMFEGTLNKSDILGAPLLDAILFVSVGFAMGDAKRLI